MGLYYGTVHRESSTIIVNIDKKEHVVGMNTQDTAQVFSGQDAPSPDFIDTPLTRLLGIRYPIIGAPMFLVSNIDMVAAISEAGGIGTFPALNFRPLDAYQKALGELRQRTNRPIGVNVIVNQSNQRQADDLRLALDAGVQLFITSLGNPREVIREAHKNGAKVFCDVTNLQHGLKVRDMGADGVIAVGSGAGGHAGPIVPSILIPWLVEKLGIPVVAAGGVADGRTMAAMLALGACGVSVGTRFIASQEAQVTSDYKQAIIAATPEDIMMTSRLSGTPVSVIRTPDVEKLGQDLPSWIVALKKYPSAKRWLNPLIHLLGMQTLEKSATRKEAKKVWSAGQTVGLIDEIRTCHEIIAQMVTQYRQTRASLPE